MKVTFRILLAVAICVMGYFCVMSVVTPIKFEDTRVEREPAVIANLIDIRTAATEFKAQNGRYTASSDSLLQFVLTGKKKELFKEGSLTDKQLEAGLTEVKAVKIIKQAKAKVKKNNFENDDELYAYIWANDPDIKKNDLQGFRRDTIFTPLLETLYKGKHTAESLAEIFTIPYSGGQKYELQVNNEYETKQGVVPLFQASAHFNTYLGDLDKQELINLIDKETTLEHFPGLKVGSVEEPNNNAGNWE